MMKTEKRNILCIVLILVSLISTVSYGAYLKTSGNIETIHYDDIIEITSEDIKNNRSNVNVGNGGDGGGNYGDAVGNSSITGTVRDEGVRVTLVNAETGEIITRPLDFANNPMPVTRWFGATCKLSYLGIGNNKLSLTPQFLTSGSYSYQQPTDNLPTIINGNLQTIKNYFGDKGFLEYFSNLTGVSYENLTSGKYKLILEPIGYPKINGVYWATTATELALYDELLNGAIRSTLVDFSHKNLPLSMFLEKEDFGIYEFVGDKTAKQTNTTIIAKLGIGIVSFEEKEEEPEEPEKPEVIVPEYIYRTNTEVYTGITLSGGSCILTGSDDLGLGGIGMLNPREVSFSILGTKYSPSNNHSIVYPDGGSTIAYVKWTTPEEPQDFIIEVSVSYKDILYSEISDKEYVGTVTDKYEIPVSIVELEENTPPNPVADDRNDSWKMSSIPTIGNDIMSNSWTEYSVVKDYLPIYNADGEWVKDTQKWLWTTYNYSVKLEAFVDVYADPLCKTYLYRDMNQNRREYILKSGYGVRQVIDTKLVSKVEISEQVIEEVEPDKYAVVTNEYTESHTKGVPAQNTVSFFSDFNFDTYWRLLEVTEMQSNKSILEFKNNRFSTYNNRTHFTPIWYPDNEYYIINNYIFDVWTPAGQLAVGIHTGDREAGSDNTNSIYILGNMWDDWYVQILPADWEP